jgi:hypothetical protein
VSDPTLPPSLAAEIADLQRRLNNLERSQRLPFSSTRGGAFVFLDSNLNHRLDMGSVAVDGSIGNGDTTPYGVFIRGDGGGFVVGTRAGDRGLIAPNIPMNMHDPFSKVVTSGTFVSLYESICFFPAHQVVHVQAAVIVDAGTVGEVKLVEGFTSTATSVLNLPAGTNSRLDFEWLHPASVGLYDSQAVTTTALWVQMHVRRVSGAGNVTVYYPDPSELTSKFLHPNAATNGHPTLV